MALFLEEAAISPYPTSVPPPKKVVQTSRTAITQASLSSSTVSRLGKLCAEFKKGSSSMCWNTRSS